jgi:ABC-type glutathione transport system ATPase component
MSVALEVRGLWVHGPTRPIVAGASFAARAGEVVAVVGPSGSGKSTFLRALCGRLDPRLRVTAERRRWTLGGDDVRGPLLGPVVTHLPQEAGVALDPFRRVGATAPAAALERVGFDAGSAARVAASRPHTLSGGMAERAALAAALHRGSPALLCDEPTTGLDPEVRALVLATLRAWADAGHLVVVVTHDRPAVARVADRVLVFRDGRPEAA